MPELPEVETTRRGLAPHLLGRTITAAVCRVPKLRLPLDAALPLLLPGQAITGLERRGKYLLLRCTGGTLLIHLGMTGHLRLFAAGIPAAKYDHLQLTLDDGRTLRLSDPRKFGTVVWTTGEPLQHPLLADLGPEPLTDAFTGNYLFSTIHNRQSAVKLALMDNRVVVGVGNIYANEACFRAGLRPGTPARVLTHAQCEHLVVSVQEVLLEAIAMGGTTLRDYVDSDGKPGYFRLMLAVYGREGEPCPTCGAPVERTSLGGRSTYWCPTCQQ